MLYSFPLSDPGAFFFLISCGTFLLSPPRYSCMWRGSVCHAQCMSCLRRVLKWSLVQLPSSCVLLGKPSEFGASVSSCFTPKETNVSAWHLPPERRSCRPCSWLASVLRDPAGMCLWPLALGTLASRHTRGPWDKCW